jgi:hypothetical protein
MKNIILFLMAVIFFGCNSIESNTSLMEDKTKIQQPGGKGIIPSDHKANALTTLVGKYSLADLDDYYRKILPQEKSRDYYDNVRKVLISSMVQSYGLAEKGDDKSIKYYLNELQALKLMNPTITLKLLIRAEKSMAPGEVKNIASKIYDFNQKIIAGMDNPNSYLAATYQEWEKIKVFSERQD